MTILAASALLAAGAMAPAWGGGAAGGGSSGALGAALRILASAPASAADAISTVAGGASGGFGGDGGPAVDALLTAPSDLAPLGDGAAYLIADTANHRIRRVEASGLIFTVAGAGPCCGVTGGFAGVRVPATDPAVRLNQPRGVAAIPGGGFLIADTFNHRIRRVGPSGLIETVAGSGRPGYGGDGDGALIADLNAPGGVAALSDGAFLIADTGNHRIRLVSSSGIITTVAGVGSAAFTGDGGPATDAALNGPARVVALAGGGYLIADTGNNRIRRVGADGRIATVAGSGGIAGFAGDGGPATQALLSGPQGVAVRPDGAIAIADTGNARVREVAPSGTIRTVAGSGTPGFGGDGGAPGAATLAEPRAVDADATRIRIADALNHRVRAVAPEVPGGGQDPQPPIVQDPAPPRQVPPGVSPPRVGRSGVVAPVSGRVFVRLRGTRRFVLLREVVNLPLGSELDARRGRVSVQFETTAGGRRASAIVSEGRVLLRQPDRRDLGQRPGSLVLSGPLEGCRAVVRRGPTPRRRGAGTGSTLPRAGAASAAPRASTAAKRKRKRGRRARVHADGRVEVRGRYGAAIVRGTRWTTVDRCPRDPRPGTLFAVSEGRVKVTAFVLRRSRLVRAGQRFLAPARRPRIR